MRRYPASFPGWNDQILRAGFSSVDRSKKAKNFAGVLLWKKSLGKSLFAVPNFVIWRVPNRLHHSILLSQSTVSDPRQDVGRQSDLHQLCVR
jgi:hypothetical protein